MRFREYFDAFSANQYSNEFSPTLGQEIEMILPSRYQRHQVAEAMAAYLREDPKVSNVRMTRVGNTSGRVDYLSSSGKDRSIGFKADQSVDRNHSLELTSSIIASEKEQDRFLRVVKKVKDGYQPTLPVSKAGLHTHVGFKNAQPAEIAVLTTLWGIIEKQMLDLYHVHPERRRWANSLPRFQTEVNRSIVPDVLREMGSSVRDLNSPKYRTLNLLPLTDRHTVEFRFANATLDETVLRGTADFLKNLVRAIRSKMPELVEYLTRTEAPGITLKRLAEAIGAEYFLEHYDKIHESTSRAVQEAAPPPPPPPPQPAQQTRSYASTGSYRRACPNCGRYDCPNAYRQANGY